MFKLSKFVDRENCENIAKIYIKNIRAFEKHFSKTENLSRHFKIPEAKNSSETSFCLINIFFEIKSSFMNF